MEIKKKKKKSLSSQVRVLKMEIRRLEAVLEKKWDLIESLKLSLREAEKIIPLKYFKIKFKIKCNEGEIFEYEELGSGFTVQHAISNLKKDKTYPEAFILIDVKLLA